ncbi:putative ABC transport system substrate-binding protein [Acetoanaerobium pronyense]|uniref:ABC transport system substrate-binding protein n=1 Tax=Acetoanaerobium pronyense TaxID=1482736 RepID=A0ABS4KJ77_9FIRM|nr:ABC transporter substrate-binding protein [Acetoanaerobium pronyense]MBP2027858.1 putative ABC transport system substrate-binding protein [Acetoanaerobium pronyense]
MKLKKIVLSGVITFFSIVVLTGCASFNLDASTLSEQDSAMDKEIFIGISQIAEHPALDNAREGFKEAILELAEGERIVFIEKNAQGDISNAQMIAESFIKDKVDMIYAIATPSAQSAYNATKDIPIIISAVTDPVAAGLVKNINTPGTNVSGTSDLAPIKKQLELLLELEIKPQTIGFIYNTSEKNSEVQLDILKEEAKHFGIEIEALGVTSITEIEQGLDVLLNKVDALYTPADNLIASSIRFLTSKALEKSIPVLGAEVAHVEGGALFTLGVDYLELGRQSGEMAYRVLTGENISEMAIETSKNPSISINLDTARILGISIDESILQKSDLIGDK